MSLVVLAAIGCGFYIFKMYEQKKLESESYCKNDFMYKLSLSNVAKAIELERMHRNTVIRLRSSQNLPSAISLMRQASNRYDQFVEERINR